MKIVLNTAIIILIISGIGKINAQTINKSPRQTSIDVGFRNVFSQKYFSNNASHGYGITLDEAWQVSGFDGKHAKSYISIPVGYSALSPEDDTSHRVKMVSYGWTVRHELAKNKKIIPFVGYGLLLNHLRISGKDGSLFGHQTQFEFGVNFNSDKRLKFFAKMQYSYASFPQLNVKRRIIYNLGDFRVGVRF